LRVVVYNQSWKSWIGMGTIVDQPTTIRWCAHFAVAPICPTRILRGSYVAFWMLHHGKSDGF
jgi:hypothetical protein